MMKRSVTSGVGIAVLTVIISAAVLFWLRPWERPRTVSSSGDIEAFPADRFERVPVVEDGLTAFEEINPFHRATRAEELLSDFPVGTEVYEFEVKEPSSGRIWRSPEGSVFIDRGGSIMEITA